MNRRPIVTYAGDNSLFSGLQTGLVKSLPQESVEWRRSYGRASRCVHVEVDFVPFSEECLVRDAPRTILGQPIFHTYWTDCSDVEAYKSMTRESLQAWMTSLRHHGVTDWMVVLLEAPDTRKGNKLLPRTTVLDKIKNDFGSKQVERCVSMVDPLKSDSRSIESWQSLLTKMRHLLMIAYNRALNRFEEAMRAERERRTEKSWSFCSYFLLQEELAQVFTLLALHDEALVQYDELDALFTQFVLNSAAGDTAPWLSMFGQSCEQWEGLHLTPALDTTIQGKIRAREVTLLEFRNYLFQRQCALLKHLNKPWEIASRALTFLQNTAGELRILEVGVGAGGVACWGLLSCLEVVDDLHHYKDPTTTDAHALHTAPLYAYARDKLQELGHLCGLMPGEKSSGSAQLHTVIALVCGMGNDPHTYDPPRDPHQDSSAQDTPMTRLKDALSSPQAFKKHFLDLSEVAISTYKHIGRIRSARLIGRDLANFYMAEGEPQKAATFLTDQLTVFLEEGWPSLAAHTQLRLAHCYQTTNDTERFIRTCAQLAASEVLEESERKEHFSNMMKAVQQVKEDSPVLIPSDRVLEVGGPRVVSTGRLIPGAEVTVELTVTNKLPADVRCREVSLMLQHWEEEEDVGVKRGSEVERKGSSSGATPPGGKHLHHHHNHPPTVHRSGSSSESERSSSSSSSGGNSGGGGGGGSCDDSLDASEGEGPRGDTVTQPLLMSLHLEYKQDKSLSSAAVTCTNAHKVLRRRDSQGGLYKVERSVSKQHLPHCLTASGLTLAPGPNTVTLTTKVEKRGRYVGGQVVIGLEGAVEVVAGRGSVTGVPLNLEVVSEGPRVFLGRRDRDLLAGVTQPMILTVHSGSADVAEGTVVKLSSSRGLTLRCDQGEGASRDLTREVEVRLAQVAPFSSLAVPLTVLADLGPQRDAATVEHTVSLSSSITEGRQDIDVHFIPPFMTSHKLHTAASAKFLQVTVTGLVGRAVELTEPQLQAVEGQLALTPLHPPLQALVVCSDQSASYMWGMDVDYQQDGTPPVKVEFSVLYRPLNHLVQDLREITKNLPSDTKDQNLDEPPHEPPPDPPRTYTSSFDIHDYKTLYTIRARVEPNKGSELCRAGNMCHLHIALQQVWAGGTPVLDSECEGGTTTSTQQQQHSIMYEVLADQTMWAVCGRTAGVLTLEGGVRQSVTMDVMPLTGGFLPLPSVRLSKYIPADSKQVTPRDGGRKVEYVGSASSVPRLQPFSPGQVYNFSKAQQVHVLPASNTLQQDLSLS